MHNDWSMSYNFFQPEDHQITIKGWIEAGILGLFYGTVTLPPDNPFEDIYV